MVMTREEICGEMEALLMDALDVEGGEITEGKTLAGDLGAESIDYLDIVFRMENVFYIKISKGELFPDDEMLVGDDIYSVQPDVGGFGGVLNPRGIAYVRERFPELNLSDVGEKLSADHLDGRYTVGSLVNFVERKMRQGETA